MSRQQKTLDQAKDTGMACVLICLIGYLLSAQSGWVMAAVFFLLLDMIRPQLYRPLAVIWFGMSHFLGGFVSRILLTAIFYLVVTPVALVRRLTGADAMGSKLWRSAPTAFTVRDHLFSKADLEKPY